jgi:hypothetical protein
MHYVPVYGLLLAGAAAVAGGVGLAHVLVGGQVANGSVSLDPQGQAAAAAAVGARGAGRLRVRSAAEAKLAAEVRVYLELEKGADLQAGGRGGWV